MKNNLTENKMGDSFQRPHPFFAVPEEENGDSALSCCNMGANCIDSNYCKPG